MAEIAMVTTGRQAGSPAAETIIKRYRHIFTKCSGTGWFVKCENPACAGAYVLSIEIIRVLKILPGTHEAKRSNII